MRIAKLTAEIGADISAFRRVVREARTELGSLEKAQTSLGEAVVRANHKVAQSEQNLVNVSHQVLAAERTLETARNGQIKQLLNIENTRRRLVIAEAEYLAVINNAEATEKQRIAALTRFQNLQNNLTAGQIQLANAVNTVAKAEDNLTRVRLGSILAVEKAITVQELEAGLSAKIVDGKLSSEVLLQKERSALAEQHRKEQELQRVLDRKNAIEYTAWWESQLAMQEKAEAAAIAKDARELKRKQDLAAKEKSLALSQAYQESLINRLSGAYQGLHKAQTFLSNSATSLTATITIPFALAANSAFQAAVEFESYQNALGTVMKSSSAATAEIAKLIEVSRKPGIDFKGLVSASVSLQAVGISAGQARTFVEEFGNQIALTGGGLMEFERTVINIRQLVGAKSLSGQEFKQMAHDIPTMLSAVKKLYGTIDTKELSSRGISGKKILEDLTAEFAKSARAAESSKNDIKNFKNELFLLRAEVGKELLPLFKEFTAVAMPMFRNAVNWFKSLSPEVRRGMIEFGLFLAVLGPISGALAGLIGVGRAGLGMFTMLAKTIGFARGAFLLFTGAMDAAQLAVKFQTIGLAATEAGAATLAGFTVALGPIALIVAGIAAVTLALYGIKKAYESLNPAIEELQSRQLALNATAVNSAKEASDVANLAKEYVGLSNNMKPTEEMKLRMQKIIETLVRINPAYLKSIGKDGELQVDLANLTKLANDQLQKQLDLKDALIAQNFTKVFGTQLSLEAKKDDLAQSQNKLADIRYLKAGNYDPKRTALSSVASDIQSYGEFRRAATMAIDQEKELVDHIADLTVSIRETTAAFEAERKAHIDMVKGIAPKVGNVGPEKPSTTKPGMSETDTKIAQEILKAWKTEVKSSAREFGLKPSSEYRPGAKTHASGRTSLHAMSVGKEHGKAIDFVGSPAKMAAFFDYIREAYSPEDIAELIYSPKGSVFNGKFSSQVQNPITRKDHYNHLHIGLRKGTGDTSKAMEASTALKEQLSLQESIEKAVSRQRGNTAELLAQMVPITPEMKYQAMQAKLLADYGEQFYGAVPKALKAEVERTVQAQKQLDIWKDNYEVRQAIDGMLMDNKLSKYGDREKSMIQAFGADKWFGKNGINIDPSKKKAFSDLFYSNYDKTQFKEAQKAIGDLATKTREFMLEASGKGYQTKSQDAESAIEQILKGVENKSKLANPWLQLIIKSIRSMAKASDELKASDIFKSLTDPFSENASLAKSKSDGSYNPRTAALADFLKQNKAQIEELTALGHGGDVAKLKESFLNDYDLKKTTEAMADYNSQLALLNQRYQNLTENDPFKSWLGNQKSWNSDTGTMELPAGLRDEANARKIFDFENKTDSLSTYNRMIGEATKRMQELSASTPFDAWRLSLSEIRADGSVVDALGINPEKLRELFLLNEWMDSIQTFASGVQDIFSQMIYNISENGFRGMFANIYQGFQKLLFKMAVEYLASQLYRSVMGFAMGAFSGLVGGGGGGSGSFSGIQPSYAAIGGYVDKHSPYIVGEHGKELFMPLTDGYIMPNNIINSFMGGGGIGGSASMNHYNTSGAYNVRGDSIVSNSSSSYSNDDKSVVVINNYYGSNNSSQTSGRTTTQMVVDGERQAKRVRERLG